ncbi:MAG: phosphonopyruvate decarboxylase, partial [Ignavibacteria bacterium]|nr:phosphonopyruvate decarboxylase [Ignavibacteria bacterium]
NLKHIIINNGAHDSVGGQPTAGFAINFSEIAKANGYKAAFTAETEAEIIKCINELKLSEGPSLLEIRVNKGARVNLGRPEVSPAENKINFMKALSESEKI